MTITVSYNIEKQNAINQVIQEILDLMKSEDFKILDDEIKNAIDSGIKTIQQEQKTPVSPELIPDYLDYFYLAVCMTVSYIRVSIKQQKLYNGVQYEDL